MKNSRMQTTKIIKNYGDTNFITGMRAFAALAVVLVHAGGAGFRELGIVGHNIADFGRTGVYVFFVISGFSVACSYEASDGYLDYLNKRLWRIAPLYYFWLVVTIAFGVTATYWQKQLNAEINSYSVFLHVFFLSFLDYRITNSIIGVEWSISIEVFWYFVLPLLLIGCGNKFKTLLLLFISFPIYLLSVTFPHVLPVEGENVGLAMHWSPIPYILSYALGIAAFRFRNICKHSNGVGNFVLTMSVVLVGVYVWHPTVVIRLFYDEFIFVSVLTTALILFGTNKSLLFRLFFNNSAVQFLGVLSYGIYLCHMPLLSLIARIDVPIISNLTLRFVLVSMLSVLISSLTFYLFEQRLIIVAKKIGRRMIAH
jgi:peptidoglycan/LPS O-acetylase OafA/YrhL